MIKTGASPQYTAGFIESMECLPVTKIPDGPEWTYEALCCAPHKTSYVAQEVMLRDSSGSAHLLAGAFRARNIISHGLLSAIVILPREGERSFT